MQMYKYFILVFLNTFNMSLGIDCNPNTPYIHLQNMKDELFMMKYGYWVKASDKLENIDRDLEFKRFRKEKRQHPSQFKYQSKSKYPDIVLQKKDDPPHFNFDNIQYTLRNDKFPFIIDNNDNNIITYAHMPYIIDYKPNSKHNYFDTHKGGQFMYDLLDKQLESRIRSLEAMIYLFENSLM